MAWSCCCCSAAICCCCIVGCGGPCVCARRCDSTTACCCCCSAERRCCSFQDAFVARLCCEAKVDRSWRSSESCSSSWRCIVSTRRCCCAAAEVSATRAAAVSSASRVAASQRRRSSPSAWRRRRISSSMPADLDFSLASSPFWSANIFSAVARSAKTSACASSRRSFNCCATRRAWYACCAADCASDRDVSSRVRSSSFSRAMPPATFARSTSRFSSRAFERHLAPSASPFAATGGGNARAGAGSGGLWRLGGGALRDSCGAGAARGASTLCAVGSKILPKAVRQFGQLSPWSVFFQSSMHCAQNSCEPAQSMRRFEGRSMQIEHNMSASFSDCSTDCCGARAGGGAGAAAGGGACGGVGAAAAGRVKTPPASLISLIFARRRTVGPFGRPIAVMFSSVAFSKSRMVNMRASVSLSWCLSSFRSATSCVRSASPILVAGVTGARRF
mmetsp:Transcript_375/g.1320  ORF Transcript_375/g.1320 Transcript_375/m.1320 type:complete len:447 (-) Transcript_375:35-1375(-)